MNKNVIMRKYRPEIQMMFSNKTYQNRELQRSRQMKRKSIYRKEIKKNNHNH